MPGFENIELVNSKRQSWKNNNKSAFCDKEPAVGNDVDVLCECCEFSQMNTTPLKKTFHLTLYNVLQ